MKILMLLQKDYPPDIRVEKEAEALLAAGHDVLLLCRNSGMYDSVEENGVRVFRVRPRTGIGLADKLINFPLFANPFWLWQARRLAQREGVQAIHAHDLPMVPLAVFAAAGRMRVVYDLHENYPAALESWGRKDLLSSTLKNPKLAARLDSWALRRADHMVVVADELKEALVQEGVPAEKVTVVSNTLRIDAFLNHPVDSDIVESMQGKFGILYAGTYANDRGLETAIRAMPALAERIPDSHLMIVGEGPNRGDLEALCRRLGIDARVTFAGWRPFHQMPSFIRASSVCLIPHADSLQYQTTIPHKLFQYMSLKKPIVATDVPPLRRYIRKFNAGVLFRADDATDFVRAVLEAGENGNGFYDVDEQAFREAISWEQDARRLADVYKRLDTD